MEPDSRLKYKGITQPSSAIGSAIAHIDGDKFENSMSGRRKASSRKKDLKVYPVSNESAKGDPEGSVLGKDESRIYEMPDFKSDGGMVRGDGKSRVSTKGRFI